MYVSTVSLFLFFFTLFFFSFVFLVRIRLFVCAYLFYVLLTSMNIVIIVIALIVTVAFIFLSFLFQLFFIFFFLFFFWRLLSPHFFPPLSGVKSPAKERWPDVRYQEGKPYPRRVSFLSYDVPKIESWLLFSVNLSYRSCCKGSANENLKTLSMKPW